MIKISISLWSADLTDLGNEIKRMEPYADFFHFDVADGHFVPLFLFFPDLIKALRLKTEIPFEVHLIIEKPERFIDVFAKVNADVITVYPKSSKDIVSVIMEIKKRGLRAGLSLSPDDPVSIIEPLMKYLDIVTIMGTNIDVRGASLLPDTCDKIKETADLIKKKGFNIDIEADGGIRKETVPLLVKSGANIVVPGSLILKNNPEEIYRWLKSF